MGLSCLALVWFSLSLSLFLFLRLIRTCFRHFAPKSKKGHNHQNSFRICTRHARAHRLSCSCPDCPYFLEMYDLRKRIQTMGIENVDPVRTLKIVTKSDTFKTERAVVNENIER